MLSACCRSTTSSHAIIYKFIIRFFILNVCPLLSGSFLSLCNGYLRGTYVLRSIIINKPQVKVGEMKKTTYRFSFQTLRRPFIANYLTLALFLCCHARKGSNSHVFRHLQSSQHGRTLCSDECFSNLYHASTTLQLKIKESILIQWGQATLNHQLYHINLKLSL